MRWAAPKIWLNGDVWIIGGGPSVPKVFGVPQTIIDKVVNKTLPVSSYSPYMEAIHNKHVIGINAAYEIGDWIDIVFFGDSRFFKVFESRLMAFSGMKVGCCVRSDKNQWVRFLAKDGKMYGISTNPETVAWNGNSGAASISMAANMGVKRIFLLGFDMTLNDKKQKHWHDMYTELRVHRNNNVKAKLPFDTHLKGFPSIKRDADKLGIEIYNVSPDSVIKEFPKLTLKQALAL